MFNPIVHVSLDSFRVAFGKDSATPMFHEFQYYEHHNTERSEYEEA